MLTVKQLKQRKRYEILFRKVQQTLAIIPEISGSNLEEWETRSKIWSLPDYPGELTAMSGARFLQQAKEPQSVTFFN